MRTTRVELDGTAGYVHIQRRRGESIIRVDSFVRYPKHEQPAYRMWTLDCHVSDDDLFKVAVEIQQRSDGRQGSNSTIHEYLRELQRFQA